MLNGINYLNFLYKSDLNMFLIYYCYYIPEAEFFDNFDRLYNKSLNEIKQRIGKIYNNFQPYDTSHFSNQIFEIELKIKNTDADKEIKQKLDNYYKIQFSGMLYVFEDIYNEISKYKIENNFYKYENFHGFLRYYKYLYINIDMILNDIERRNKNIHNQQPTKNDNIIECDNRIKGKYSFESSKRLKMDLGSYYELYSFNASVFLIRQSIELKIKNALGIDYILNDQLLMEKIPGDIFIEFVYNNDKIDFPNIQKSILRKIHKWTNYFIHGGFIVYIWQIHIAHKLLEELFKDDAIRIEKRYYDNQLKSDLETYIKSNCNSNNNLNKMQIIPLSKPEAMLY